MLYLLGILAALLSSEEHRLPIVVAMGLFVSVAVIWLVPDRRIERVVAEYTG